MADVDLPFDSGRVTHMDLMHRTEDDAGDPIPLGYLHAADGARGHTWTDPASIVTSGGTLLDILGWYDAIVDGGLAGDNTTDDTTALSNLIDTATASGTRSAVIYFPPDHEYLLAGNVTLPAVGTSSPQITIAFVGGNRPPFQPLGSIPNPSGYSMLRATATTGTAVFNGGTSDNNIAIVIKNLLCIGPDNPTITFWHLAKTYPGAIEGLMISVTPWTTSPTYPTHSGAYGVTLPENIHSNGMTVDGLQIGGYYTCIRLGELERGRDWVLGNCHTAMEAPFAYHAGIIESVQITAYTIGLQMTGTRYLDILQFDTERRGGSFATTWDIDDSGNQLHGYVRWLEVTAGVGVQHVFDVNGGANALTQEVGPAWGASAITVKDEGTPLATGASSLDFVGSGVVASGTGAGKTITISGAPTGSAGGDLSGTYPNPSVVDDSHSHTAATLPGTSGGQILVSDTPASSPLVFADLLQNEAGTDLVYADA